MAKKDHYKSVAAESLKLKIMMEATKESEPWNEEAIEWHEEEMNELLEKYYDDIP